MKPHQTCEYCDQSSKETELLCNQVRCKVWVHHECYQEKVRESKVSSLYFCEEHRKKEYFDNKLTFGEFSNQEDDDTEDLDQDDKDNALDNNLNQSVVDPPKHVEVRANVVEAALIGDSTKNSFCKRCKKALSDIFTKCLACESLFHHHCLDTFEKRRVENLETVCTSCHEISQRTLRRSQGNSNAFIKNTDNQNSNNEKQKAEIFSKRDEHISAPNQIGHSSLFPGKSTASRNYTSNYGTRQKSNDFRQLDLEKTYSRQRSNEMNNTPISINSVENACGNFMEKYHSRDLPEVTDDDYTWSIFYDTFQRTAHLFKDHENIVRIKKAIISKEVLRKGGAALFNAFTYREAIESINKRIGRNLNFLHKEAKKLLNTPKIKTDNYKKIIEFIDSVRSFVQLTVAYRDNSYMHNKMFINSLIDCLPSYIITKWIEKQCILESRDSEISLKQVMTVLETELVKVECRLRNSQINMSEHDQRPKLDKPKSYNTAVKNEKVKFDSKFCWLHRNNQHPSHKCKALWSMDGKIVSDLAKQNNRCTTCGQAYHQECPVKEKLMCKVEECNIRHHALYCYKRKGGWKPKTEEKSNTHNETSNETDTTNSAHNSDNEQESETDINNIEIESDSEKEDVSQYYTNTHYANCLDSKIINSCSRLNSVRTEMCFNTKKKKDKDSTEESDPSLMGVVVLKLEDKLQAAFLLDSGSNVSLIEQKLANQLKSRGPLLPISLGWSGEIARKDNDSRIIRIKCANLSQPDIFHNICFRTVLNLKVTSQKFVAKEFYKKFEYLRPLKLIDHEKIEGIIGTDYKFAFDRDQVFRPKNDALNLPDGIRSPLGDYLIYSKNSLEDIFHKLQSHNPNRDELRLCNSHSQELTENELKEMQEMEREILGLEYYLPTENDKNIHDELLALKIMTAEIKRLDNSPHFESPLLWRDKDIILDTNDSYKIALRRFLIVEKHAKKIKRFHECEEQMTNLLQKGYARELSTTEINSFSSKSYYNPIFYIFPKGKRFRMIWDLASKTNGRSINDLLLSGPNLYNNLLKIIFQMCEHQYMFKADMQEMFHQIKIKEEDTDALRFLFRYSNESQIRVFKMLVLPFGASCSPAISQFVKNIIGEEHKKCDPRASEIILNSTYVDDIVTSFNNIEEAKTLPLNIKNILHKGGFNLLKFNTNEKELKESWQVKTKSLKIDQTKLFSDENEEKILGYKINFLKDTISLALSFGKVPLEILNGQTRPTKRQFLQLLMSIYDPVGFFQFIVSKLKLIYHNLCLEKKNWEDELSDNDMREYLKLLTYISRLEEIKIPRRYALKEYSKIQLFGFGDAGFDILCAVIYARFLNDENEQVGIRLIHSKTFIVPAKQNRTIPELELNIASLLSKTVVDVKEKHTTPFEETFLFTDNSAVYEWIIRDPKKPSVYVKNRLNTINALTEKREWNWIPTEFMPADYGTKSSAMPEFSYDNYWFFPKLFRLPETSWPQFKPNLLPENVTSLNTHRQHVQTALNKLDPENFKSYNAMIYAGQFYFKLKANLEIKRLEKIIKNTEQESSKDVHNRELRTKLNGLIKEHEKKLEEYRQSSFMFEHTEKLLIKKAQHESFSAEIESLKKLKKISKSSKYSKLLLWIDEDGLLRVKTRITFNHENMKIFGYDRIFPILLPKNHRLTTLIIQKEHKNKRHIFNNSIIAAIRSRFHIPNIYSVVKKTTKDCQFCLRYNAVPLVPLMGDMPSFRLESHIPPFTYAMVDISGPYTLKVTRKMSAKRYIFICTCLNTRAVHMELIESLDANATLLALQNTMNLRGCPKKLYSDNGTNFHGANKILKENCQRWNIKLLEKGTLRQPIEWHFGPARSPHTQGAVERLIGLMKKVMNRIITIAHEKHENLNDFSFRAIIAEVISIMNNRPLSMSTCKNSDILTPNHFLLMRANAQEVPCSDIQNMKICDNWLAIQNLSSILWSFWTKEYFPKILLREKWVDKVEPLKVDDIVITFDPTVSNSWRLGRITKVDIGSKNQTRKVEVLLGKNNVLEKVDISNKNKIIKAYVNEKSVTVTRHASSVAKIKLDAKF